jgi:hypothetical protein
MVKLARPNDNHSHLDFGQEKSQAFNLALIQGRILTRPWFD